MPRRAPHPFRTTNWSREAERAFKRERSITLRTVAALAVVAACYLWALIPNLPGALDAVATCLGAR